MKRFLLVCFLVLMAQSFVLADEIIDAKGNIIPCRIETVMNGFIEYTKDGLLYSFPREKEQVVYNDYVDVRVKFLKKPIEIRRISGKILVKDLYGVRIRNEDGDMSIPWYRVKFVGIYKPE